jgi:hypothetical protein
MYLPVHAMQNRMHCDMDYGNLELEFSFYYSSKQSILDDKEYSLICTSIFVPDSGDATTTNEFCCSGTWEVM